MGFATAKSWQTPCYNQFASTLMERAGRLIGKLKIPKEVLEPEALACAAWPVAVGRKIGCVRQLRI